MTLDYTIDSANQQYLVTISVVVGFLMHCRMVGGIQVMTSTIRQISLNGCLCGGGESAGEISA